MADLRFRQTVTAVSVTTSLRTIIQLKAAAQQRVVLREFGVSFQGSTNTDPPALVQLYRQTTAGTSSAGTPVAIDGDVTETIQTTTGITFTSTDPTAGNLLGSWYVHQQTGIIVPLSTIRPIVIPGGGRLGLVITAGATVNCSAYLEAEE